MVKKLDCGHKIKVKPWKDDTDDEWPQRSAADYKEAESALKKALVVMSWVVLAVFLLGLLAAVFV